MHHRACDLLHGFSPQQLGLPDQLRLRKGLWLALDYLQLVLLRLLVVSVLCVRFGLQAHWLGGSF